MNNYQLNIIDMGCDNCIKAVTKALNSIEGINNIEVTLGHAKFTAEVIDQEAVVNAIDDAGFGATFSNE